MQQVVARQRVLVPKIPGRERNERGGGREELNPHVDLRQQFRPESWSKYRLINVTFIGPMCKAHCVARSIDCLSLSSRGMRRSNQVETFRVVGNLEACNPKLETRNPEPETRNPKPETRDPKPETQKTIFETRNPKPRTQNTERGIRNPEPETPKPENRNPTPETRIPKP